MNMRRGFKALMIIGVVILWLTVETLFNIIWPYYIPPGETPFSIRVALFIARFSNISVASMVVGIIGNLIVKWGLVVVMIVAIVKVARIGRVPKNTEVKMEIKQKRGHKLSRKWWVSLLALFLGLVVYAVVGGLTKSALSGLTGPYEFKSLTGGFSITSLGKLVETTESKDSVAGKLEIHIFSGSYANNAYSVMYVDYPASGADPQKMLDGGRNGALSSSGRSLVSEKVIALNGYPGRELVINSISSGTEDVTAYEREYLVKNRMYILEALARSSLGRYKAIDDFFDSFKLLPGL